MLADGGLETRVIYEFGRALPEFAAWALLDDDAGRDILHAIYASYLSVAKTRGMAIQIGTPTWRASARWIIGRDRSGNRRLRRCRRSRRRFGAPVPPRAGVRTRQRRRRSPLRADVSPPPDHYMLGCLYPTHARAALEAARAQNPAVTSRIAGLKANASPLSPEELDRLGRVDAVEPNAFAHDMMACAREFELSILGGCCGTDARHIEAIAATIE